MTNDVKKTTQETSLVPIKWNIPEHLVTRFATNMLAQTIENEFKLSFFEIKPPIRFSESEPKPSEVNADCIASIIITADRLPNFIRVLQEQLDQYNKKKDMKENPSET
ncbi:MAG TPA: hypothetical protein VMS75_02170 [Terriglobales bacterium]|nr:hypothetical protein [Terriglobales bacterium]